MAGFSEGDLTGKEDLADYQALCCSLSYEIMTDPMYALGLPNYLFERGMILHALKIKREHPIDRSDLAEYMLVPDVEKQAKIEAFMAKYAPVIE